MDISAESDSGLVKVAWVDLGEGTSGDYDPDDPGDIALLRYDAYVRIDADPAVNERRNLEIDTCSGQPQVWAVKPDGSYCTNTPAATSAPELTALARLIANELADTLETGWKRRAEELSHAHPDWLTR